MRLTKSTSHAIRILLECAGADDRLVKVAVLSERLDITQQNIFKIVNLLTKAGLLEAVRGRNGGVKLARPAGEIRIGDVVRASEVTRVEIEDDEDRRTPGTRPRRQPDPRRRARRLHRRARPAHVGRYGQGPAHPGSVAAPQDARPRQAGGGQASRLRRALHEQLGPDPQIPTARCTRAAMLVGNCDHTDPRPDDARSAPTAHLAPWLFLTSSKVSTKA